MLEVHNMNFPLNSILLLKERLIKVETLLEKYSSLTKKYNDLEKLHHQSIENEKKAKKDATKYLEKYCKLSKKCDALLCEIENYEDALKKKTNALEEIRIEYERIESLLQVYKKERSVLQSTSSDNIKKDKDFLLSSTWRLFKESDRSKNRLAIAIFFKRFKSDLEDLKLEDFRNIKSNKTPKSSAAKETKAVLISHETQITNTAEIDSVKSSSTIESEKFGSLGQVKECCIFDKSMHQQECSRSTCKKLEHHSAVKSNDFLNSDTTLQVDDSLNSFFYDMSIMKDEENNCSLCKSSIKDNCSKTPMLEELHIGENVSSYIKNEILESKSELFSEKDKTDFQIHKSKNFEEAFISPMNSNELNVMQNSNNSIERKLMSNYKIPKNSVSNNNNNKTDLSTIMNKSFVSCKTYKKKSKRSAKLDVRLEKNLPVSCDNIDYVGSPSEVIILNTDIMNGDLKISSDSFGILDCNLTGFDSISASEQKNNTIPKSMPHLMEKNEMNSQPENILINKSYTVKSQTEEYDNLNKYHSIFNIENETLSVMESKTKNSCKEDENFTLEFGEENKNIMNENSNKIVIENTFEKDEKSKSILEGVEKNHENDLKEEKEKSACNTHLHLKKKVAEIRNEDNNPNNKSSNLKSRIQSISDIADEEINKVFQSLVNVPLLSPIKDSEQKLNVKSKHKEIQNNSKCLLNFEKRNDIITKENSEILENSVNNMKSMDCNIAINQRSPKNNLVDLKNISPKEKKTEDKFVQTDTIKDIFKEEKCVQCTEISDKSKKLPISFNNFILKIFKKIKKEILKRESSKKRSVFDNFFKKCKEDHCICLDFVLVLLKIFKYMPKFNYDKMIKFTVKLLKMMKMEKIKVRKKPKKKKVKKSVWKIENEKDTSSVAKENNSLNSFNVPEMENVNKMYCVNEKNSLNSVAREMEYINVFHHVIHSPYDLISSNRIEVLQRIQPIGFFSRTPQDVQNLNSKSARNFDEENLASEVMIEQNSQIVCDRYKQENNYMNSDDWAEAIMPRNNFVTMNKKIDVDFLKAENNLTKFENCEKKNMEFASTKISELKNISNTPLKGDTGIENSKNELELVKNNLPNNDSSISIDLQNAENKLCKSTELANKKFDDETKNFCRDDCLDKMDCKENSSNESQSKAEELIQILNNDSKLFPKDTEPLLEDLEAETEHEEFFTFQEKDFYTPPIISPFESEILDENDEELDYSVDTFYSYKNLENTNKMRFIKTNNNAFQYNKCQTKSKLNANVKKLPTFCKQDNNEETSVSKIHRGTSKRLHGKLDEAESIVQNSASSKRRKIGHQNFDLNRKSISEDRNFESCKPKKKAVRQLQQSVISEKSKNVNNLSLQCNGTEQDTMRENSVNFLDSILSAMTKQAEYFKTTPGTSIPVTQLCNMNAVSIAAQQTSPSYPLSNSNLELKQDEILHNSSNSLNNSYLNHSVNIIKDFQNENHANNVNSKETVKSCNSYEDEKMKRLVEKAIKEFLKVEINSTIEAEEKMKPCIAILGKATEDIISKVIVSEIMTNVDEELQEFDRPAPPLTKTQHRLICILTVLTDSNNQFSSISYNILKVIRSKIFPEKFFWPDDSLEMATRFYAALCKKLNNFKEIWKFCFKALTHMRQRWSIVVYVVLQIWPDILHDATKVKDNILVNTFVNLILHSSKTEDCRRKRQQNRLLALKHLLKNFYEFEINCTIEDFTKQTFESFFTDALGADKALVLISKCRDWCWTKKHIIPKLTETIIAWGDGKIDDIIGKKSLQIIHQICWIIPLTDETINSPTEFMISGLQRLLNSQNLNQISKEKVAKILCALKHHANVKEILSSSLEQFSYNKEVLKKIQNAILLSNSMKDKQKKIECKKDQNKPIKRKLKRKKRDKKKHSNSKTQEHLNSFNV